MEMARLHSKVINIEPQQYIDRLHKQGLERLGHFPQQEITMIKQIKLILFWGLLLSANSPAWSMNKATITDIKSDRGSCMGTTFEIIGSNFRATRLDSAGRGTNAGLIWLKQPVFSLRNAVGNLHFMSWDDNRIKAQIAPNTRYVEGETYYVGIKAINTKTSKYELASNLYRVVACKRNQISTGLMGKDPASQRHLIKPKSQDVTKVVKIGKPVIKRIKMKGDCIQKGGRIYIYGQHLTRSDDMAITMTTLPPASRPTASLGYSNWTATGITTAMPSDNRVEEGKSYLIGLSYAGRERAKPYGTWMSNTKVVKVCGAPINRSVIKQPLTGLKPVTK